MESSGSRALTPASSDLSKVTPTRILSHFVPPQKQEPDGLVKESWLWGPDGSGRKSLVHSLHRPRIQGSSFLSPRRELVMMADVSVPSESVAVSGVWWLWTEHMACSHPPVFGDAKAALYACISIFIHPEQTRPTAARKWKNE